MNYPSKSQIYKIYIKKLIKIKKEIFLKKFLFAFNLDYEGVNFSKREFRFRNIENDFKLKCLKVIRYQYKIKNYYSLKNKLYKKKKLFNT